MSLGKPIVLKVDPDRPLPRVVSLVASLLGRGELIIYPTETVYGLGCDPYNPDAVEKVYMVKKRGRKPLPLIADSLETVVSVAELPPLGERLARIFWPGPLTLILPLKDQRLKHVTAGLDKVGLRVSSLRLARSLAERIGGLIVATSANLSGGPNPLSVEDAISQVGYGVRLALDGGPARSTVPSTVVDLSGDEPRVLRWGAVGPEVLNRFLRR